MELIRLPGYTEPEKLAIATRYLWPKQREQSGLKPSDVELTPAALEKLVRGYTKEAGVRGLEREVGAVCRKIARRVAKRGAPPQPIRVGQRRLEKLLGPPPFRVGPREVEDQIGLANGLAWTQVGGETLEVEATVLPGSGKLLITGKLGDVMQESAQAAMSYVRSRAPALGLEPNFYATVDVHLHVPEGAMPKDGPSAGITIATAMISALTRVPVRRDLAMTGEVTLRGRVLPIGGLKEKLLAAHRAGHTRVVFPRENEKDLHEVPRSVRSALTLVPVDHVDEVLLEALIPADTAALRARLERARREATRAAEPRAATP
jgi:ATP-dependent Lon protease